MENTKNKDDPISLYVNLGFFGGRKAATYFATYQMPALDHEGECVCVGISFANTADRDRVADFLDRIDSGGLAAECKNWLKKQAEEYEQAKRQNQWIAEACTFAGDEAKKRKEV